MRSLALLVVVAMLASLAAVVVLPASPAAALGTTLFSNSFANSTVSGGIGTVTVPTSISGTNAACLTAKGNTSTGPLLSCPGNIDIVGSGKLRLTNSSTNQVGGVFGLDSFPSSSGLDVTFNTYQWGGGAADGMAFMLAAVDPANPASPPSIGPSGGSLGYSPAGSVKGLPNAYLGVGVDVFGNFSSTGFQGTGCTNVLNITSQTPGAVVVRGPGNGSVGYCGLATTFTGSGKLTLRAATRAASLVPVQVLINPTGTAFTSTSGVAVPAHSYKVVTTAAGGSTASTISGTLPTVAAGLYPSASWLNTSGVPKQLAFAFVGSTGSVTDNHEVDNVKVVTFNAVPQLSVATTSYSAATSTPGDPVTMDTVAKVATGADEGSAVSVTQTVPAGVAPQAAFGAGWVCADPVGQSITCTTTASSFANGTTLPTITLVGIVTGASVSAAFIQANTTTRVSSADADPGTVSTAAAGSPSAKPTGITLTPAIGPVAGGNRITATGQTNDFPRAIEVGTTAEQQAGTPVVLLRCANDALLAGCFSIVGSNLVITSMPARASPATVRLTAVTQGADGFASYVYADSPVAPAAPTATAGISSTTVSWVAPTDNGSPITGYVVVPYLNGAAQTPVNYGPTVTSNTFTGLASGGSWTYTVAATNAYGTSAASPKSAAVVPYVLPGAPTITAASAGDSAATLTWTAPSNGGNAITAYVVTPYIGGSAQTTTTFGAGTTQTVTGLTAGTAYTFTVAARNAAGTGPPSARSSAVTPNLSPSLTFAAPPPGEVGAAYSTQLTATNGTSPFVWSVSSGTLPAGLTLNATTGLLSGTPTAGGSSTFTVKIVDASAQSATRSVTLVVADAPAVTFAPAAGEVGVPYSQQPTLSGGTAPYAWVVSSGSLPAGLAISPTTGAVTGTPTASGSFSLTVSATDSLNQVASRTVTLVVVARPAFTAAAPAAGQVGVAYSTTFDVTGGTLPLTWSVTAGSAPPGLTLNTATGALTGTPTTVGSSTFTVSVVDSFNQSAAKTVTIVVGAGPLVIAKTANVSSTAAGGTVTYTVTVTNTGSSTWTGASLSDPLSGVVDDATYNADATTTSGTLTYSAGTLGWTGNVAASATVTIGYSVTVNQPDTGNKVLSNTVTSATLGTNCASGSTDARCTATVNVAGLAIVKTADVSTTTPGSTVHVQIMVTNTGPVAATGATLTDDLTGVLDDAAYNADATATTGSVTFASPSLTWTGTLAAGASATITYSVTVKDPDTGNRSLSATIVSSSPGSSCPSGNPAASCTVTVAVLVPALVITNTASLSTTTPGATVPYTVTLSNTGQTAYTGTSVAVALAGALDDATYDNNAAASSGTVGYSSGTITWTGSVPIGAVVTITGSVTVNDPDAGNRTLTTVATSPAAGSTCRPASPAAACTSTVQVLVPALAISTSTDVSTTTPGSVVTYTVAATNSGQTAYTGATFSDSLTGVLDDATYNGDATASAGAVAYSGSTLTWTGGLAIGATATVTFTVTVRQPDPGDKSLVSTVSSTTAGNNCRASSSDPRCTSTVSVLLPGLRITSSADTTSSTPGGVVHYVVTVTNSGQTTYQNVVVVEDLTALLDDATYNNDAVVSSGSQVLNANGTASWTLSLAPGASATSTISMTVHDPDTGNRSLDTIVSSNAAGSTCPTGSANPACRTSVQVLVPGLMFTKTADRSTVTPGEAVGYTVSVSNTGETTYPAATFTDDLSQVLTDATYAGGASATTGTVSFSSPTLSWTGSLAPGESATISYTVTVRDPDPGDKILANTVVSSSRGSNCAAGSADARCAAGVRVLVPGLAITTTADAATTKPGAVVGYSVVVTNSGATVATGAALTDALAGILDDASYNADVSASAGTASVSGSTLSWSGTLAVGATATVTYSVTVHAADGGDNLLTDQVTSNTRGNNCAVGSGDTRCTSTVPVARLVLAYPDRNLTATPGSTVHYTATYTNTGQVPYTDIDVAVQAQDAADDVSSGGTQTASSGTFVLNETGTTWTGSIPVGGVVTVSATLDIRDPDTGDGVFTATMESSAPGSNCPAASPDPRCRVTTTVLTPQLTLTKVASTTVTVPGGTVGYTITVHNTGQTAYVGVEAADTLAGVLDDAAYNGDATTTSGSVAYNSPTLTWTGDLAVGATATITYSVTARSPGTGDKTMVNPVSSTAVGSTCPPASGSAACRTTVAVLTPALTIVKTADRATATLDSSITYTVKVTNSGQTTYPSAAFSDSLAGVLDDATYTSAATTTTSGAVDYAAGVLSWSGALAPGVSATITYAVRVNNPDTGDRQLTNTATSTNVGANCPSGSDDSRCTALVAVTNSVSLTFTKTADVAATKAGATVHYTVTASNSSGAAASASFSDPLSGILDDADYDGNATASAGTVGFASPNLTWSGTVPAAGTVTVTYSVTVHAGITGNQVLTGTLSSTLPPSSNNCLSGSLDPRCTSTVPVAGLLIQQHFDEASTTPGSLVHLSATFTNTGEMPYNGISVSSPSAGVVDDAIPTGDQTASSGSLVLTSSAITWTGNIPVGGTVTVTGTLTVENPDQGDRQLTGTLVSQALGNNCPTAGTDTRCTATLNVLLPGLTVTKTADTTFVVPGGVVAYTLVVHNTGETAYDAATVTDSLDGVLDDATYDGNVTTTSGAVAYSSPTLTWTGSLAVGATATIGYSVTASSPGTGDKTMVNVASSTEVGSTCPPASGNAGCRSTVAVLTPALSLTSSTSVARSAPGGSVGYTLTATNTGQTAYAPATFSVDLAGVLDDATVTTSPTATSGTPVLAGPALSWSGALAPGDSVTVSYAVTVTSPPAGDFTLAQTLVSTVQGSTCPAGGSDPGCTTTVPIASLRIDTSADVPTTKPTGVVRNTTVVTNTGQVVYRGAVVADDFSGTLDDATYNGDATATSGSLTFDVAHEAILWTGDLAPGESVTVTGSNTVNNPVTGNGTLTTVVSTDVVGSNCQTGAPGPECLTSVAVLKPGLTITKAADVSDASPGDTVGYTITAVNTGETGYTAATITDPLGGVLNDAAYDNNATATSGTVDYSSGTITWTGDLAVRDEVQIHFTVTVDDPYLGDGVMSNTALSDELGSTCPTTNPGAACSSAVDVLVPALDISVTADRSNTVPGGTVGYTVTVTNTGQTAYAGAVVTAHLTGALDDATYAGGATSTTGAVTYTEPDLTWTGDLAVGDTATISYALTVADPDTGNRSLDTSVSSAEAGSTCGSSAQCLSSVTVLLPGLAVSTTSDVATATPGDRVGFTITVANTGQTDYVGAEVSTDLSGVVDDAAFDGTVTATTGVASYTAPTLAWRGDLPIGATATIHYAVTVRSPDTGDRTMATTVVAPAQGSTCPVGSADSACTATVQVLVPGLTITKTSSSPTTTPGSVVGYTIVVANTGETAYAAASVEDSLARVVTDADYNGDAVAVGGGTLSFAAPVLTW
ncbi:MAG: putative Ig domain-containing protein, partial [Nocardioidaceae bacterium]